MNMEKALQGQVAIVTGGATGLGRAMALQFAEMGATLVIASRNMANLQKTASEIEQRGVSALPVQCDVRHPEQVEHLVTEAISRFGKIDILVNNAAGNFICPTENLSFNGWNSVVNIVLNGTFYCSQTVGKRWIEEGRGGSILNIVATYAWTGSPGVIHSASAKAGVVAMTRTLGAEWGKYGIRVNAIAPGPIENTGGADRLWGDPQAEQQVKAGIPLGRLGKPEEVAHLAAFMVSPYASYMSGEVVTLDGAAWLNRGLLR
ncbi:2,4-dienoyl-CoA reductase [Effusibacillus dendaii]|uniref:2,4-dienoyl-CoA reductase n=1 Tax=Effusibacillus dendaii TaxID=2743772 RepID=A0A7I8DE40_9BACL|nr:2,4-dienoyl-CoA reductase [Effusibacillus dendaii]